MKQKTLAMLGVAVGCGLVAAVAVAKLGAGGSKGPDTTKVLVAKKDLPLQTKLDETDLENLLTWADMPKSFVPPDAVKDIEQVKGKSLTRTLKMGNPLSITDIGKPVNLDLPDGCEAMTVKLTQAGAVNGFAKPGSRVDIMYMEKTTAGKARAAIILKHMLVLAVNIINENNEKTGPAIPQVESVTLAVNKNQATRLVFAQEKGTITLLLTGTSTEEAAKKVNEGAIGWVTDPFDTSVPPPKAEVASTPSLDKMVVAKKEVPLNTLINADNLAEFFTTANVEQAPEGVIQNPDDLRGRYFIKAVEKGTIVYKSLTGSKPVEVAAPVAVQKFEKMVQVKKAIPLNTLIHADNLAEFFETTDVKQAPEGVIQNPDDLRGRYFIKAVEKGTIVYKSLTDSKPVEVKVPDKTPVAVEKPKYPRYEQIIQTGGMTQRVTWMEVSPKNWKSFDSAKAADEYKPEAETPKGDVPKVVSESEVSR